MGLIQKCTIISWGRLILLLFLFAACSSSHQVLNTDTPYNGIDISHYQGDVDWGRVTSKGHIRFVYIKATEGKTFVDKRHSTYARQAHAHGLLVGFYHFFRPGVSGAEQFANYEKALRGLPNDLLPVLDIEVAPKPGQQKAFEQDIRTFIKLCRRRFGKAPILYCIPSFERKYLKEFSKSKKWYCGRIDDKADMSRCLLWQIAIKNVPGIYGKVDWDYAPKVSKLKR